MCCCILKRKKDNKKFSLVFLTFSLAGNREEIRQLEGLQKIVDFIGVKV